VAGSINSGGGGGGAWSGYPGKDGGSGKVLIRYLIDTTGSPL
jgi:hypothetical protein